MRKVRRLKRAGFFVRLYDNPPTPADSRSFSTARQAYRWAQEQLAASVFKYPEVVIYHIHDVVKPNHGSFKATRVMED